MTDVLLVGAPNSGKSALFNRLTGLKHKVANYPGITIDVGKGCLSSNPQVTLWDFPGTYSLNPVSAEEQVAIASLHSALQDPQDALVAMALERSPGRSVHCSHPPRGTTRQDSKAGASRMLHSEGSWSGCVVALITRAIRLCRPGALLR